MKKLLYTLGILTISLLAGSKAEANDLVATSGSANISNGLKGASTKIDESNTNLTDIKDSGSVSPNEELSVRKQVIKDAIILSLEEVENLKTNLNKLSNIDEGSKEAELRIYYLDLLDYYAEYYFETAASLEPITTIEDIKKFAKEIIDFRTNKYNPDVERIADFLLLFYNLNAVSTANSRLIKISSDIKKLEKVSLIKPDFFKTKLEGIMANLEEATKNYIEAKKMIIEPVKENEKSAVLATPRQLMEKSLNNIKLAYEGFIQISRDIRKAAGLR